MDTKVHEDGIDKMALADVDARIPRAAAVVAEHRVDAKPVLFEPFGPSAAR